MADVDVVLLDMDMPRMGGLECMRHLLSRDPDVKVIALSGHLLKLREWDPVEDGARAFVQKPFDAAALLSAIQTVLDDDLSTAAA